MRNHFLEEAYTELTVQQPNSSPQELLEESPTQEQEWLSKNVINHLQRAIDGLNISRSYIPTYISRNEVKKYVDEIQDIQDKMLDIWHNIQDVSGDKQPMQPLTPSHILSGQEISSKIKALRGIENPNYKNSQNGQAKFTDIEKAQEFANFLKQNNFKSSLQGATVNYTNNAK